MIAAWVEALRIGGFAASLEAAIDRWFTPSFRRANRGVIAAVRRHMMGNDLEIEVFRREIADILAAMEIGGLESIGHIRPGHISMIVARPQRYGAPLPPDVDEKA